VEKINGIKFLPTIKDADHELALELTSEAISYRDNPGEFSKLYEQNLAQVAFQRLHKDWEFHTQDQPSSFN
jgi:hypothetical protein